MLLRTQMGNLLLVEKQGNHGGIAPTPKSKDFRRGCAPMPAPTYAIAGIPSM
jgi:hypothetical protein